MKVCLVAIAKLENSYIKEWVNYYKNLGIDNIILFDNNDENTEKIYDVLYEDVESGFVIYDLTFFDNGFSQCQAYNYFFNNYSKNYDWGIICDIDEYVTLINFNNIKDFLSSNNLFANYHFIHLFWKNFSTNGYIEKSNFSIIDSYCENDNIINDLSFSKIIVNCNKINKDIVYENGEYFDDAHHINDVHEYSSCDTDGNYINIINCSGTPNYNHIYIRHFFTKSLEEFINNKIKKGINYEWVNASDNNLAFDNVFKPNCINYSIEYENYFYNIINKKINNITYYIIDIDSNMFYEYYNLLKDIYNKYDIVIIKKPKVFINEILLDKFIKFVYDENTIYTDIIRFLNIDCGDNQVNIDFLMLSNNIIGKILNSNIISDDALWWFPYYTFSCIINTENINVKELGYMIFYNYISFNITTQYNIIYYIKDENNINILTNFIDEYKDKFIIRLPNIKYKFNCEDLTNKYFNSNYIKKC